MKRYLSLGGVKRFIMRGRFIFFFVLLAVVCGALAALQPFGESEEVRRYNADILAIEEDETEPDIERWRAAMQDLAVLSKEADSDHLRQASFYNFGTEQAKWTTDLEFLRSAEYSLEEAVRLDPEDEDAKRNLELLRYKIAEKLASSGQGQGSPEESGALAPDRFKRQDFPSDEDGYGRSRPESDY